MTRILDHRCLNCQVVYSYQSSGYNPDSRLNNDRYCPTCWDHALSAFKEVPKVNEKFWEVVTDPDELKKVLAHHEDKRENPDRFHFFPPPTISKEDRDALIEKLSVRLGFLADNPPENFEQEAEEFIDAVLKAAGPKSKGIPIRQIGSSLFKHEGNQITDSMHTTIYKIDRVEYSVAIWHKGSSPPEVKRTMERDLRHDATRPWRFCSS